MWSVSIHFLACDFAPFTLPLKFESFPFSTDSLTEISTTFVEMYRMGSFAESLTLIGESQVLSSRLARVRVATKSETLLVR